MFGKKVFGKKIIFRYVINYFNNCLFLRVYFFVHPFNLNKQAPFSIQTIICVQKFVKEGIVTSQVYFWSFNKPAFSKKTFYKKVFGKKRNII